MTALCSQHSTQASALNSQPSQAWAGTQSVDRFGLEPWGTKDLGYVQEALGNCNTLFGISRASRPPHTEVHFLFFWWRRWPNKAQSPSSSACLLPTFASLFLSASICLLSLTFITSCPKNDRHVVWGVAKRVTAGECLTWFMTRWARRSEPLLYPCSACKHLSFSFLQSCVCTPTAQTTSSWIPYSKNKNKNTMRICSLCCVPLTRSSWVT